MIILRNDLFSGCCYLLNPAINPFLYSIFSKRFRRAFLDLAFKSNIRCFNQNDEDRIAVTSTRRHDKHKPYNQVINRQAMLRHFDLKTSNDNSKLKINKNSRFVLNQENSFKKHQKTLKTQSLHYVNTNSATPRTNLVSEPISNQKTIYTLKNEDSNIKKYQTLVNLKSTDKAISFYLTPTIIDGSSDDQAYKNITPKDKRNDYIYKVIFQSIPEQR